MQKLMGDEGWGGGPCFSLLTPSVCVLDTILSTLTFVSIFTKFRLISCAVVVVSSHLVEASLCS